MLLFECPDIDVLADQFQNPYRIAVKEQLAFLEALQ
jgi:hypothetical protein